MSRVSSPLPSSIWRVRRGSGTFPDGTRRRRFSTALPAPAFRLEAPSFRPLRLPGGLLAEAPPRRTRRSRSACRCACARRRRRSPRDGVGQSESVTASGPPASPEAAAIHAVLCPMTSTTSPAGGSRRWSGYGRSRRWRSGPRCRNRSTDIGAPDVVVDRLRQGHDVHVGVLHRVQRVLLRPTAADADEGVEVQLVVVFRPPWSVCRRSGRRAASCRLVPARPRGSSPRRSGVRTGRQSVSRCSGSRPGRGSPCRMPTTSSPVGLQSPYWPRRGSRVSDPGSRRGGGGIADRSDLFAWPLVPPRCAVPESAGASVSCVPARQRRACAEAGWCPPHKRREKQRSRGASASLATRAPFGLPGVADVLRAPR